MTLPFDFDVTVHILPVIDASRVTPLPSTILHLIFAPSGSPVALA